MNTKNIVIAILALVLGGAIIFLLTQVTGEKLVVVKDTSNEDTSIEKPAVTEENKEVEEMIVEPSTEEIKTSRGPKSVLGQSAGGEDITAYHFGVGETELLFVGGVHGAYSPNTSELANSLVEHFNKNPNEIPNNISITIIPTLNPDGSDKSDNVAGRFNANNVDLNRNFDCEWSETATWRNQEVSGGTEPFSEPEAAALRDYITTYQPKAAVVWFSAEGKVYPSSCGRAPGKASIELAATFATAAGYPAEAEFDAYAITGDMVNWMSDEGVTAISVLLSDHKNPELDKNLRGVGAVIANYAE